MLLRKRRKNERSPESGGLSSGSFASTNVGIAPQRSLLTVFS